MFHTNTTYTFWYNWLVLTQTANQQAQNLEKQNWATEILIEEVNRNIKSPNFALFDVLVNIWQTKYIKCKGTMHSYNKIVTLL